MLLTRVRILSMALLLIAGCAIPAQALAAPVPTFEDGWYRVSYVIDGDTIRVDGLDRSIRLAGIDAPETVNRVDPYGFEATHMLRWLLYTEDAGWVYLRPAEISYDSTWDRYRAYVWIYSYEWGASELAREFMAWVGLANVDHYGQWKSVWYYDRFAYAEALARQDHCYIWGGIVC